MDKAREQRTGRLVPAEEIGPDPEPFERPLICLHCDSVVEPVRGYKSVPSLFRLAKGTSHEAGCLLNPTEVIQSIAHGSHGLAHVTDDGLLRLELPADISALPPWPTMPIDDTDTDVVRTHNTTTVRPYLPPAITSAAKIARFLHMHGFDPKVVERFRVKPHGQRPILWGRFCYSPRTYADLYQRCARREPISHPIAVHGTVHSIAQDRNGKPYARLALDVPAGDTRFHVLLRSAHDSLIKPLTAGTHVLAVGDWTLFDTPHVPQLRLFADEHWQIAYWETDPTTGLPTEPICPAPVTARQRPDAEARARTRRSRPAREPRHAPAQPESITPPPPPALAAPPPQAQPAAETVLPESELADEPAVTPPHPEPAVPDAPTQPPPVPPQPPFPPPPVPPLAEPAPRRQGWRRWFGRRP
ncbi:hypothetical protein JK359_33000 [Streptomyces actinomycinicus]|uniref:Uncharacterized protein n=1 Tax=Streptomyces actinomycinicus TaxID=1695166 RepID=A0A937JQH9_9ACTN|nr:hypothetical protein [Streptomyces actinomycinicus]MBL1086725.1 hypothetical protein [Streptomyces actinomycinicus]